MCFYAFRLSSAILLVCVPKLWVLKLQEFLGHNINYFNLKIILTVSVFNFTSFLLQTCIKMFLKFLILFFAFYLSWADHNRTAGIPVYHSDSLLPQCLYNLCRQWFCIISSFLRILTPFYTLVTFMMGTLYLFMTQACIENNRGHELCIN